jgi:Putative adhesin
MKFKALLITLILFSPSPVLARSRDDHDNGQKVERKVTADPNVAVSICIASGDVHVRGWDKNEVSAQAEGAAGIQLRRKDSNSPSSPASRLDILIGVKEDNEAGNCQGYDNVTLYVPKGATVQVQSRDGNIGVAEVASAYASTQNGDISFERISKSTEACSIGGNVSLKDSTGRVTLSSAGGNLEATNIRPAESRDSFEAVSVSGDITLRQVSNAELNVRTVNGTVNLTGALALHGRYGFRTMSGDVTLSLPEDASFKLTATVSQNGEIITDFPLTLTSYTTSPPRQPKAKLDGAPKAPAAVTPAPQPPAQTPEAAPANPPEGPTVVVKVTPNMKAIRVDPVITMAPYASRRVNAIHGSGDASITIASFNGTVHLRKE